MFCPLDCWDSCELTIENNKFKPTSFSSFLCKKVNNYVNYPLQKEPIYYGKNVMLSFLLKKISQKIKKTNPNKILFIKGSGNMGIMQNITKLFFNKYGAFFAVGSTCDGVGEIGINKGRGKSLIIPTWIIKNSKNILIWGRNPYVTNTHLLPLIRKKRVITIDVVNTKTAKNSDYFIKIKPNSDYFLAILLAQEVIEKNLIKNINGNNFEKYKSIVLSYDKEFLFKTTGVLKKDIDLLLEFLLKKGVVLTGLGVAKCKECYKTTWAIDSLFFMMDFFGKEDSGVAFLGSSNFDLFNPFDIKIKNRVGLFDIDLDQFDLIFIQGANPLVSFVNRKKWEKLKDKTTVVFGKYMDETAKIAKMFIPTKDFYAKLDVRGSYFNEFVLVNKKKRTDKGISEYELTKYLFREFGFGDLEKEDYYVNEILNRSNLEKITDELYIKKYFKQPPYKEKFFTKDGKFNFLTEKFSSYQEKEFFIVTAKAENALNSQFNVDSNIYVNQNFVNPDILKKFKNIKFDNSLDINIIYTKGGKVINAFLKSEGENAYYDDYLL